MTEKYRRVAGTVLNAGTREVLVDGDGVHFWCPCGERMVYAASPPHTITFDADGLLTLDPSCSTAKNSEYPKGWCHFWLKDGEPEMVSSAQCPGRG